MLDPRFGLLYELARIIYGGFSYMDSFWAEDERWGEESRSKKENSDALPADVEVPKTISVEISAELFKETQTEADIFRTYRQ